MSTLYGKVENFMGLNFLNMILTIYNHYYNNLAYFKILY